MAVRAIQPFQFNRSISGNSPQKLTFQEAATQTYKKGAVVQFNASGFVQEGGANPINILGVATQDGQNLTTAGVSLNVIGGPVLSGGEQVIDIANLDNIFVGNAVFVTGSGAAAAATAASSIANAIPGIPYLPGNMFGITKLGTGPGAGNWVVDLAKQGSNRRVMILNMDPSGTGYPIVTDTYALVEFIFFDFFTQFGVTS